MSGFTKVIKILILFNFYEPRSIQFTVTVEKEKQQIQIIVKPELGNVWWI